jgi:hypothetical protein
MKKLTVYRYSIISMLESVFRRLTNFSLFGRWCFDSCQCPIDMEIYVTVSAV